MKKYIKAKDVKKLYAGTSEFSLIDIREIGQHTDGHPFFQYQFHIVFLKTGLLI